MLFLAVIAAAIGLPLFALAAAGVQWLAYRVLLRKAEPPWFGVLLMRGMVLGLVILAGLAVWGRVGATPAPAPDAAVPAR